MIARRTTPRTWRCTSCLGRSTGSKCDSCGTRKGTLRVSSRSRCDKLAGDIVKYRAGLKCERCGKPGEPNAKGERIAGLDWSHRPSAKRSHSMAVRYADDAADALCRACHTHLETRPVEYNSWLVSRGVDVADLERRAHLLWDKQYPVERLRATLKALKEVK